MSPHDALLVVSGIHLGFQATVTGVVYPALADVPDAEWTGAHDAHSRRIVRLVVPLYAALLVVMAWALLEGAPTVGTVVAVLGTAVALATTAVVAAPLHARLGRIRTPVLVHRLLRADRVRTVAAAVAMVGALVA